MRNPYTIRLCFPEPVLGPWDHGHRLGGEFSLFYPYADHPGKGEKLVWGSMELNCWFTARSGRSWRQAAAGAVRRLRRLYPDATILVEETPPEWAPATFARGRADLPAKATEKPPERRSGGHR